MSKYTISSIFFLIALFGLIYLVQQSDLSLWVILIPILPYLALLVVGSTKIGFNFYFRSICKARTTDKIIALTFDDGPNAQVTPKVLDILDQYQVSAGFFCIGNNLAANKVLVRKMNEKGHIIANHSYSHSKWFDLFTPKKMAAELKATNAEIERIIGHYPTLFRPSYGVTNPWLKKALERVNMYSIGWSLRSFDTVKDADAVLKKLKRKTKAGDVVLFHDTDQKIVTILKEYLNWLKENNFKVVSLTELLNLEAYETN